MLLAATANAGPRTSASYTITADTVSHGGTRTTSAAYTNDGTAGGIVGISIVTTPAETAKHGYIGQLTEVTALQLAASPTTVNEGTTRQLTATATLDDATTSALLATDVSWSVQSGPLTSISTSGLATAGIVYQNTAATAQGLYSGITGTLNLTVINTNTDDIPGYSGDGLDDAWQVQYFGLNNPLAAPLLDPDGDGHTNVFENLAGIDPTSAASFFRVTQISISGGVFNMTFPTVPGRSYQLQSSSNLANPWINIGAATAGTGGMVTLPVDVTGQTKHFFRVSVGAP
ncbi:MAG TPA: hypothetical protein DIT13_00175 [Verrucomicrobiales bacterium]|nr:hypothetical protein [Verrucomicrobiales bacterium]HRJ10229.1 hypothetical protein [Prosthecobacter sp.]HRK13292.1 hypothetical protein [Prosthecobacter sp.]